MKARIPPFERAALQYPWQVRCHRVRNESWATRELAQLIRRDAEQTMSHAHEIRRRCLRVSQ
jgi:hypothetical protein